MGNQARTRAQQLRTAKNLAARRARKRTRILSAAGGVVILGLVVAIVVSLVSAARDRPDPGRPAAGPLVVPASATANGAVPLGNANAPVTVDVYLDYMCPFCGRFERANGAELQRLLGDGTIRLNLYALAFLDKVSAGTQYSTRAANAVATVADRTADKVQPFSLALFNHQPQEGGAGLTDAEIAALARDAGVPQDVVDRFTALTFQPWVARWTDAALTEIHGTPTVKINGKVFAGDLYSAGPLTAAVIAAKG